MTRLTKNDRLKLLGMQTVVTDLWRQIEAFQRAAASIVGEIDHNGGHCSDYLFGDSTVDELWERTADDRRKAQVPVEEGGE